MGKDLKGKDLGKGITQTRTGLYLGRKENVYGDSLTYSSKDINRVVMWMNEDSNPFANAEPTMTVDAWYKMWMQIIDNYIKYNTKITYETCYRTHIMPLIGWMEIEKVMPMHCQSVLDNMKKKGLSAKTIGNAKIVMKSMFLYAFENDIVHKNPCNVMVRADLSKPAKVMDALTSDEQRLFLKSISGSKYENVYRFVLQTGLRYGEVAGLKWGDIDLRKKIIKVQRSLTYNREEKKFYESTPKTHAGIRVIPLTDEALNILQIQKQVNIVLHGDDIFYKNYVFCDDTIYVIPLCRLDNNLYSICKRNNLKQISMHVLRHTFATRCAEAGMDVKVLQALMGHTNISTTMDIYVSVDQERVFESMQNAQRNLQCMK